MCDECFLQVAVRHEVGGVVVAQAQDVAELCCCMTLLLHNPAVKGFLTMDMTAADLV